MALPQTTLTYDIHCVTHWSKLDTTWTGVRVVDLMEHLQLEPGATHVMQHSVGGYTTNLSLEDFTRPEPAGPHLRRATPGRRARRPAALVVRTCTSGRVPSG